MLWAGLVRVSHLGRRDPNGDRFHSVADQERAIRQAAGARGDTVHMLPPELDVSGGRPLAQRPGLLEAVQGVESGRYGGLAVAYLSRMGRELRTMLEAWDRIEQAGGRVLVVREQIDTGTPAGRLHRNLLAAIDVSQREQAAELFDERRRVATEQGIWKQRQTPLGYVRDPATRRLVIDPATAGRVRDTFTGRAAGVPVITLAERIGYSPAGVRGMLANRTYLGELHQGQYVNMAAHEPLIDPALFDRCQTLARPARARRFDGPAMLAGLARCQGCGHVMSRAANGGGRYVTYSCRGLHSGGRCPNRAAIAQPRLDQHVEQTVTGWLAGVRATGRPADRGSKVAGELAAAERELAAFLAGVTAANLPAQVFAAALTDRQTNIDRLRSEQTVAGGIAHIINVDMSEFWTSATMVERNHLLCGLLDAVIVRAGTGNVGDRTRLIRHGSGLPIPVRVPGRPLGIHDLPFPDLDSPVVLGPATG